MSLNPLHPAVCGATPPRLQYGRIADTRGWTVHLHGWFVESPVSGSRGPAEAGVKMEQLVDDDFAVRAAAADAFASTRLTARAARAARIRTPLLDLASDLYKETVDRGHGRQDMIAVIDAIRAHTAAPRCESDRRSPRPEPPSKGDKCSGGAAQ